MAGLGATGRQCCAPVVLLWIGWPLPHPRTDAMLTAAARGARPGAWGFARAFRIPGCSAWGQASHPDLAGAPDIGTDVGRRRRGVQVHGGLPERSALWGAVPGGRRRIRTWPGRRTSARTWAGGVGAFRCMGVCPSVPHSGVQCLGTGVACGLGRGTGHQHGPGPAALGRSGAWGVARAFRTSGCSAWGQASHADLAGAPDISTDLARRRRGVQVHGVLPERSASRGAGPRGRHCMRTWPGRRTSARTWAGGAGAFRCMGFCPPRCGQT